MVKKLKKLSLNLPWIYYFFPNWILVLVDLVCLCKENHDNIDLHIDLINPTWLMIMTHASDEWRTAGYVCNKDLMKHSTVWFQTTK